jgi:hypothetical protein
VSSSPDHTFCIPTSTEPCSQPSYASVRRTIRVKKEDSAFIYFIFESYEGIASYSTLDFKKGDAHRDLELRIPPAFLIEVDELLTSFGDLVYLVSDS